MSTSPFLTLLNPALSIVFSIAFFILWRYQPRRLYLAPIALSYFAVAVGFLFQYYTLPIGLPLTRMLSNTLFLGAALLMTVGIAWRYNRRPPYVVAGTVIGGALIVLAWFMFIQPNVVWRVYTMNFAVGALLFVIAAEIRATANKSLFDKVLICIFVINGTMMFGRTIATVQLGSDLHRASDLHQSMYWLVFTFSHAVISLISVLAIIGSVAADVVTDLKTETETDALSGLLNRRGFEQAAKDLLGRGSGLPTALFIADLDHFKSINDTFGHHVGDRVISLFAAVLREVLGTGHPIGRIGGEEFAVIVRSADVQTARLLAEGVRVAFSCAPTPGRAIGRSRRLTASFGVAEWNPNESFGDLLSRADAALYDAKNAGRDCVRAAAHLDLESAVTARTRRGGSLPG